MKVKARVLAGTTMVQSSIMTRELLRVSVFMNNGGRGIIKSKAASISRIFPMSTTPLTKPAGVPANFTFAGWYDNELCEGTAYDFTGKTMPAQNITLYAKWQAPVIEATVYLTASADGDFKTIRNSVRHRSFRIPKSLRRLLEKLTGKALRLDRFQRRAVQCRYQALQLRYDFPVLPLRKGWLHGHIR